MGVVAQDAVLERPFGGLVFADVEADQLLPPLALGAVEHQAELVPAEIEGDVQEFVAPVGPGGLEGDQRLVAVELHLPSREQVPLEGMAVEGIGLLERMVGQLQARAGIGGAHQVQARVQHLPEGEFGGPQRAQQAGFGIPAA